VLPRDIFEGDGCFEYLAAELVDLVIFDIDPQRDGEVS
jgi:hypothetical protein